MDSERQAFNDGFDKGYAKAHEYMREKVEDLKERLQLADTAREELAVLLEKTATWLEDEIYTVAADSYMVEQWAHDLRAELAKARRLDE